MRRVLSLSALALVLAGLGLTAMNRSEAAADSQAASTPVAASTTVGGGRSAGSTRAATTREQRYDLAYRHQVEVDGNPQAATVFTGTWTTARSGGGRLGVTLGKVAVSGGVDTPPAAELETSFEIAEDAAGSLDRLGFEPGTSAKARGMLGTLASALWFTPGDGERWTAQEQDRTGQYEAVYARDGQGTITRTRGAFGALRGPKGLDPARAGALSSSGDARFSFDREGLREVVIDERITMHTGEGMPVLVVHVEATLRRADSREVAVGRDAPWPLEALLAHGQEGERGDADAQRLGGAGVEDVLAGVGAVASMAPRSREEQAWRTRSLLQARALLRVQPGSADAVAEALKDASGKDARVVGVLAAALGEAGTDEANAALVDLLASDMPASSKENVIVAMGLGEPTAEGMAALEGMLSDEELGSTSALALGAQAHAMGDADPDATGSAVAKLIAGYEAAQTTTEKLTYLNALANSGSVAALPVMRSALASGEPSLTQAGAYGLRFIPGAEADELLASVLTGQTTTSVRIQGIRAVAHRAPADWRAPLLDVRAAHASVTAICAAVDQVLAGWG